MTTAGTEPTMTEVLASLNALSGVVNDLARQVNSSTVVPVKAPVGSGLRSILSWIETEAVTSSSWWHSLAGIVTIALGAFMPHSVVPQQAGGLIVTADAAGRHVVNAAQAKAVSATATAIAAQP